MLARLALPATHVVLVTDDDHPLLSASSSAAVAALDGMLNGPPGADPCSCPTGACFAVEQCANGTARNDVRALVRSVAARGGACLVAVDAATGAARGWACVEPMRSATVMGLRAKAHALADFGSYASTPVYVSSLCCDAQVRGSGVGTALLRAAQRHGAGAPTYLCVRKGGWDRTDRTARACDALDVRSAALVEWYAGKGYAPEAESADFHLLRRPRCDF